jgi:hypothetical protein
MGHQAAARNGHSDDVRLTWFVVPDAGSKIKRHRKRALGGIDLHHPAEFWHKILAHELSTSEVPHSSVPRGTLGTETTRASTANSGMAPRRRRLRPSRHAHFEALPCSGCGGVNKTSQREGFRRDRPPSRAEFWHSRFWLTSEANAFLVGSHISARNGTAGPEGGDCRKGRRSLGEPIRLLISGGAFLLPERPSGPQVVAVTAAVYQPEVSRSQIDLA